MGLLIKIAIAGVVLVLVLVGAAWVYFQFVFTEPVLVTDHQGTLEDVAIQPTEAIALAEPHLAKSPGPKDRTDRPLRLTVIRHDDWYYLKRSNYPAKALGWYKLRAVKVHTQTGEVVVTRGE